MQGQVCVGWFLTNYITDIKKNLQKIGESPKNWSYNWKSPIF